MTTAKKPVRNLFSRIQSMAWLLGADTLLEFDQQLVVISPLGLRGRRAKRYGHIADKRRLGESFLELINQRSLLRIIKIQAVQPDTVMNSRWRTFRPRRRSVGLATFHGWRGSRGGGPAFDGNSRGSNAGRC